ncbi:hypothetical protein SAMN05216490_0490 [Mucilaginibacter mallensis]|uniref:Uncharacterized protein n=1 Tax=Mucilaginibacter mallensis TaxID=652787 RepID=A0A1H1P8E1_MUCMA|nr:hypothetical protein SAMN05216490_0490 [Mucilaginibacter mallensis]
MAQFVSSVERITFGERMLLGLNFVAAHWLQFITEAYRHCQFATDNVQNKTHLSQK